MASILQPGLIALHGNRTETLAETVFSWLNAHPLAPLEQEVVLVQSNAMAEWFKMQMAQALGVCAAARVELPARFLWRSYRQVLGAAAVPRQSALDKTALTWRLMQLLPQCASQPGFAPIADYLSWGKGKTAVFGELAAGARLLQLAQRLSDLFDQYQIYRADWLDDWAQGRDVLHAPGRPVQPVPEEQLWQPRLWRCVLAELDEAQRAGTRTGLQRRVLERLEGAAPMEQPLARRVVLFGMSHLPLSTLQVLAALSRHSQILLAVPNPCRFHWADAIDGRELLRAQRRRQPLKNGRDLAALPLEFMHAHAHPLLLSWGRQARDYVRQLDAFETALPAGAELPRVDIFDEAFEPQAPLLTQVQQCIRDMLPLAEHGRGAVACADQSIVFHCAHSMVRELEVLHDQLLALFAAPPAAGAQPLQPRDVVVMVPSIEGVAASIRAVFGQYGRHDARHIPFDIADLGASENNPLVAALQWLLRLPAQRCRLSELRDLLDVPAVAARFGLKSEDLPQLSAWMAGAGIRWGLSAAQRGALGLAACGEQNSAWFGLYRMLLGFASGSDGAAVPDALADFAQIEPYAEVAGLHAELAGQLATLLERLLAWWELAGQETDPAGWAQRFRALLADFFAAQTDSDRAMLAVLDAALTDWLDVCALGGFTQALALPVAQQAWIDIAEQPSLDSRFRAGGVTFCTLMPMRAIPFEVVCLLGMNDGDYPRRATRSDFDLMAFAGQLRAGDRARRDDDRQLMLDALLSARRILYISWAGRSVRDNSEQPPSVLVSQLREYLAAGWRAEGGSDDDRALLEQRTFHHPLQPFSRRYFTRDASLSTYAREWRAAHLLDSTVRAAPALAPFVADIEVPLTLAQLHGFVRNPAQAFFRHRLNVHFPKERPLNLDEEAFAIDGLAGYQLVEQLQLQMLAEMEAAPQQSLALEQRLALHVQRIQRAGSLPLAGLGERKRQELLQAVLPSLQSWLAHRQQLPRQLPRQRLHFVQEGLVFDDWLEDLRAPQDARAFVPCWLELQPRELLAAKGEVRPAALLLPYLRSLAAAACGKQLQAVVVGRDATLVLRPMLLSEALAQWQTLLQLWQQGQDSPLPLPLKTALAAAAAGDDGARVESVYEGDGFMQAGEVDDLYWARLYPDFAALTQDGRFALWAQALHGPLLAWVAEYVQLLAPGAVAALVDAQEQS